MVKCSNWLESCFKNSGCENVRIIKTKGHPIVYADKFIDKSKDEKDLGVGITVGYSRRIEHVWQKIVREGRSKKYSYLGEESPPRKWRGVKALLNFWGCCYEFCSGFLKESAGAFGRAFRWLGYIFDLFSFDMFFNSFSCKIEEFKKCKFRHF